MTKSDQVEARLLLTGLYAGVVMHALMVNTGVSDAKDLPKPDEMASSAVTVADHLASKVLERLGLEDES